jgi:hypothetical protein
MMLVCGQCGANNPLGRVFCVACGSKLNITGLGSEEVADLQKPSFLALHYRKIIIVVAALIVVLIGLGAWPRTKPLGVEGTSNGGRGLDRKIKRVAKLRPERSVTLEISEKDINGYFTYVKLKREQKGALSVSLEPGSCSARMVRSFGPWKISNVKISPKFSFDIRCVPVRNEFAVRSASVGHLPLPGPLKFPVAGVFKKLFAAGPERDAFEKVSEIVVEAGQVTISTGRLTAREN